MKLLITGDIHGQSDLLEKIIDIENNFDLHLNTGDLGIDQDLINKSKMVVVKGNCDFFINLPKERIIDFDNKKILLIHGHTLLVKFGLKQLVKYAKKLEVDICIFGHTHVALEEVINGILFINPGALVNANPSYAVYENGKVRFENVS